MKPKSLEELAKQIEAENELFNALSIEEKRVAIAKDALVRIELELVKPMHGYFIENPYRLKYRGGDLKTILNTCDIECDCCAKGTLFISVVGKSNSFHTSQLNSYTQDSNRDYSDEHLKLKEFFDIKQLDLIETAFEGESYLEKISKEEVEKAIAWKKKQKVGAKRLLQRILRNIIKNKGTFVV